MCVETSKPHQTECTKYFKCIVLPNQITSWISMECPEGLIYDDNLKSCSIPDEDWDCVLSGENSMDNERDENNVYGIDNLEVTDEASDFKIYELENKQPDKDDDEFIEVIDGAVDITSPSDNDDVNFNSDESGFSGDGSIPNDSTNEEQSPTTPSNKMITSHLQRLNQLVKRVQERQENIKRNDANANIDLTADDLNSFLSNQKIQNESPEYQKINFNSHDKTPMPNNGEIHPEILSEILNKQNKLMAHTTFATTLSMDSTTSSPTLKNGFYYERDEPETEIQLTSAKNPQGYSNHQIVVNRPEGSVLFNVPAQYDQTKPRPYLSEDILKTVLELSKQMVATRQQQQSQPQPTYSPPQPIYYAIPYPIISPQNNVQNYYTNQIKPNTTRVQHTTQIKNKPQVQLTNDDKKQSSPAVAVVDNKYSQGYIDSFGIFHSSENQPQQQPSFLNFQQKPQQQTLSAANPTANYYYQNYPSSNYNQQTENLADDLNQYQNPSSYQSNYQNYPPVNYQYHANNQYPNYNQLAFDGNYNGNRNRPFVIESSAPSYLEQHSIRSTKKPFKKESYATSPYDSADEDEYDTNVDGENDETLSDYLENSNNNEYYQKPQQNEILETQIRPVEVVEELICSLGTRQPNITSCLKYYVCNPMTKEVLTYTCPAFTAFNDRTRICDVASYSTCQIKQEKKNYSYNENQKMYQQAFKALEQAKRESQRAEKIANLVQKESHKIMNIRRYPQLQHLPSPAAQSSRPIRIKNIKPSRPQTKRNKPKQSGVIKRKKKGRLCPDVGKVADPDTNNFYYHCFREQKSGKMKRMKLQCNVNLIFCAATKYCTSENRC